MIEGEEKDSTNSFANAANDLSFNLRADDIYKLCYKRLKEIYEKEFNKNRQKMQSNRLKKNKVL